MTRRHIEIRNCDRCKRQFERSLDHSIENRYAGRYRPDHRTLEIGWFETNNGSGSKTTRHDGRAQSNLDRDCCPECTASFHEWWRAGDVGYTDDECARCGHPHPVNAPFGRTDESEG